MRKIQPRDEVLNTPIDAKFFRAMTSVIDLPEIAGVGGQTPTLQPAFAEATARQALNMYPIAGRLCQSPFGNAGVSQRRPTIFKIRLNQVVARLRSEPD
ncbi:MAG: hypothetical protein DME42_03505 [Verrucomicrobia bacterium]|nr:MAG: hypothetical protein DME42_03505 [Verrucomicrobiota bacterium]